MANYLDIALPIVEKDSNGELIATPYFEDYLYKIISSIGGEGAESIVDESTSLLITLVLSKIAKIEKDFLDIEHPSHAQVRAKISQIENEIFNITQVVLPVNAKISTIEKSLNDLANFSNVIPLRADVARLNASRADHDSILAALHGDIAFLRQIVNKLRTDPVKDFYLEVSKGNIPGHFAIGKFGEAPSGIQITATDIWSRADATPTQQIWLAPTAASIHTISSDNAQDVSGGTGTTSVTVYYLPDWDTAETSVTVTGDIDTGVSMGVASVMINRMVALPQSTSTGPGPNKGTIIATAAAPSATTITAVILPEEGQTEQAIYGFPRGYTAYLNRWAGGIDKVTGAAASADFQIRFNPNPDVQELSFIRKRDASVQSTGSSAFEKHYVHDNAYVGPGIIKAQAIASAADTDGYSEFDITLIQDGF